MPPGDRPEDHPPFPAHLPAPQSASKGAAAVRIDLNTTRQTELIPITDRVQRVVRESGVKDGFCLVFVPHTTAAVTVNENADPMVIHDLLHAVDRLIPLRDPEYRHVEGNSAAHLKASLFGSSQTIPVESGGLLLGVWQGVFFCEFDGPRSRQVFVKLISGKAS